MGRGLIQKINPMEFSPHCKWRFVAFALLSWPIPQRISVTQKRITASGGVNVYIRGSEGPGTADMHLHPRSSTTAKARCQWLIWNRCDRLIIFHLHPQRPTVHLLCKSQCPGNSHHVQDTEQALISSSSFHSSGQGN